jgi:peroxiredoxin
MAAAGDLAPDFQLNDLEGDTHTLTSCLASPRLVLAFFKVSCPTCQLSFPFLQRAAAQGLRLFGISQDDSAATELFGLRFGLTFPLLLDREEDNYSASNAYGIHHVPTLFVLGPAGEILERIEGFDRDAFTRLGVPFLPDDKVPLHRPG